MSRVLVWLTPTGWEECVDAALAFPDAEVAFLQVSDPGPEPPGLLGRHRHPRPPVDIDEELLDAAEERLGREAERLAPAGRPEHAVIGAAEDFDLLILSRSSGRPGPHSLAHATRFVVDHATIPILLVAPGTGGPPPV
jgi:nucleotide-binding universal stress UspA family protein